MWLPKWQEIGKQWCEVFKYLKIEIVFKYYEEYLKKYLNTQLKLDI